MKVIKCNGCGIELLESTVQEENFEGQTVNVAVIWDDDNDFCRECALKEALDVLTNLGNK